MRLIFQVWWIASHPTVADPGFPRDAAANSQGGSANIQFCQIFPKNCMKLNKIGPPGRGTHPKFYYVDLSLPYAGFSQIVAKPGVGAA